MRNPSTLKFGAIGLLFLFGCGRLSETDNIASVNVKPLPTSPTSTPSSTPIFMPTPTPTPTATPTPSVADVYVSDLSFVSEQNLWGPLERDMSNGDGNSRDGRTISIRGQTYTKGLGVHGYSEVVINLGGRYARFKANLGLDDEISGGTVVFSVKGDSVVLYTSPTLNSTSTAVSIDIPVAGVQELRLIVDPTADGTVADHADWGDAILTLANGYVALPPTFELIYNNAPVGVQGFGGYRYISYTGTWFTSGAAPSYPIGSISESLYSDPTLSTYRYTFNLDTAAVYGVFIWYTANPFRSTNVPITVHTPLSSITTSFNQTTNGGQWIFLGNFSLPTGSLSYLEISNSNGGQACTDAVKLIKR